MPEAERPLDFIALGRAAVDLYGEQIGARLEDMSSFAKYLGGCPANISVGAARLGLKPAMITRVGDEHMGRFVRETLAAEGVDVSHVRTDPKRATGLVILGIRDRDTFPLIFYRDFCADMAIAAEDFDASARALVVTGTHFSTPGTDWASRTAMRHAREAGTRIVFDIDYRPVLWGLTGRGAGENRFVESQAVTRHLQSIVPHCDLIVGTEEEIHIAGGSTNTLVALRTLRGLSPGVIVLKRGHQGCAVFTGAIPESLEDGIVHAGFPVEVLNVLGAGDAFLAGLLRGWLSGLEWHESAGIANACGALVVSRHGCAPAMPSWTELQEFFIRFDKPGLPSPLRLHADLGLAEVHRVTAGRRAWPQVCALAFDHRRQFEELAARHAAPLAWISRFKALVGEALLRAGQDVPGAGGIVDDRYGGEVLFKLTGRGLWLARAAEKPTVVPLQFEHGPDITTTLRAWPAEQVAKALVTYRAGHAALQAAQEQGLAALYRACVATGHELLVEVILPPESGSDMVCEAMRCYYAAGVRPDWWKLPPMRRAQGWQDAGDILREQDRYCRGMLVLGQDAAEAQLQEAFRAAANEPLVKGFAVGRSIFWESAEAWFGGRMSDRQVVDAVAANYARIAGLWRRRAER
jgi:5-dehydro-2-deoxygluconokinase